MADLSLWQNSSDATLIEHILARYHQTHRHQFIDILPLAEYFLGIHASRLGLTIPSISPAAQAVLEAHRWPGNTRELENVIHFALLLAGNAEIGPEHLELPGGV